MGFEGPFSVSGEGLYPEQLWNPPADLHVTTEQFRRGEVHGPDGRGVNLAERRWISRFGLPYAAAFNADRMTAMFDLVAAAQATGDAALLDDGWRTAEEIGRAHV